MQILHPKTKQKNPTYKYLNFWLRLFFLKVDTNQSKVLCEARSATSAERGLSASNDVFIWRHRFSFVFLLGLASQSSPSVSLSPLKADGPWPLQRRPSKPSSFQPRRWREPPLFPPTGNIPFSCRDNFIHLVRHCIQLNAESYGDTRVNWSSVHACVERRGGVTS